MLKKWLNDVIYRIVVKGAQKKIEKFSFFYEHFIQKTFILYKINSINNDINIKKKKKKNKKKISFL